MRSIALVTLSGLAWALAPFRANADVLVVDSSGGGAFTGIQAAVNAAADGDTILVKTGDYGPVTINHKGLQVVADTGASVSVTGGLLVEQTLVIHEVVLAGLSIFGDTTRTHALSVNIARGPVRVEDCALRGVDGELVPFELSGAAASILHGLDVSFARCTLQGGQGHDVSLFGSPGGCGIDAESSSVAVHDSQVLAGDGGDSFDVVEDYPGRGGHGAVMQDSILFASGSTFAGGDGGTDNFLACLPGGNGLFLAGSAGAGTTAHLLDNSVQGGVSGCGPLEPSIVGGTVNMIPGTARRLVAPTPVREATVVTMTFAGEPGDDAFLLFSLAPSYQLLLPFNGVLLLQLPLAQERRFMGIVPASGTLVKQIPIPGLGAGVESATFYLQSIYRDVTGGVWLASPSNLVILDDSF